LKQFRASDGDSLRSLIRFKIIIKKMRSPTESTSIEAERQLQIAENYFQEIVASQAEAIDRDPEALKIALKGMGDRALLALRVPQSWGGSELDEKTFHRFQIITTRYSGALAFLQTQHQSAGAQLATSNNESLKQAYLPRLARGEILLGLGFSQLRRPGKPLLKAIPVAEGYQLNGEVPWVTGFGFFNDFIVGATLPDGKALYGIVPLQRRENLNFSQPMQLAVANSTNTVKAWLQGWFLKENCVVAIKPTGAIHESDQKNVLHHGFFALGCAQAGLDIVLKVYREKRLSFVQQAFEALNEEVNRCFQAMLASDGESFEERLKLRAWAIELAGRCSQAAVAVSGGTANDLSHRAQRVYREALLFTVSGQTVSVMEATLARLLFKE
jgi:alkylation response protein AidB-like acyl-CoA dehydrogenase